jgi:hypothetical protein
MTEGQLVLTKLVRRESDYYALRFFPADPAVAEKFSGEIRREREQMADLLRDLGLEHPEIFISEAATLPANTKRRTLSHDQAEHFLLLVKDQKLAFGS